ncbi:hypothetical protein AJ79_05849 [Helicocarpus griseus UAMH5409]|uniref:Uncharacterized protein n=1 Tax=Helicocarpus griseus UAMH5409 TaxID=1447875 RepID=A0A2B7XIT5_9EURO|nr:hypothetical protein AJ79_05849 [Helicocarpus griseus UAMH5409]
MSLSQPVLHIDASGNHSPRSKVQSENVRISDPVSLPRSNPDGFEASSPYSLESPSTTALPQTSSPTTPGGRPDNSRRTTYNTPFNNAVSHTPHQSVSSGMTRGSVGHRRRASTLKTVMRKIFGRKRRSDPESAISEHHNDFAGRSQWTPTLQPVERPVGAHSVSLRSRSNRAPSLPNQAISPAHSSTHSPFGNPRGSNPPRSNSGSPRPDHRRPRRRATLPSIVLSAQEARELANQISRDHSRPSSTHSSTRDLEKPASLPRMMSRQQKRRSRSASALRDTARAHRMSPIQWRRRSDEIKFWRESLLKSDASPSVLTRPETRSTIASVLEDESHAEAKQSIGDPFNFSSLMGTMQDNSDNSLAQRVNMLEVKLMDLEFAIAKLQGHDVSPAKQTFDTSVRRHSPQQPGTDPPPFISSFQSTPSITPPRTSPTAERPSSTVTLRPYTASNQILAQTPSSSVSDFKGISVEQYSALTTLVRREQSARKLLEEQLFQMQRDIALMHNAQNPAAQGSFLLPPHSDSSDRLSSRSRSGKRSGRTEADSDDGFMEAHHRKIEDAYRRANMETSERGRVVGMI